MGYEELGVGEWSALARASSSGRTMSASLSSSESMVMVIGPRPPVFMRDGVAGIGVVPDLDLAVVLEVEVGGGDGADW